jgi:hypothetical protein
MQYNDSIAYNQSNLSYLGTLEIRVPTLSLPIILNDINIVLFGDVDYSNSTTVGLVTINSISTGYVVIEATEDQATAISQSSTIFLNSTSEITLLSSGSSTATVEASIILDQSESEISIEY